MELLPFPYISSYLNVCMVVNGRAQVTAPSLGNTVCCLPVVLSVSNTSVNVSNEAHNMVSSYTCLCTAEVVKGYFYVGREDISTGT